MRDCSPISTSPGRTDPGRDPFHGCAGRPTVNAPRLSQLGWWRGQRDPLWGEIFVSPILGALAALAIYLVGSAGLLLTSDFRAAQSGASALSASFIGLLGFLSGFLYDDAFGRVRRVGAQLFAGDTVTDAASNVVGRTARSPRP
jgi:hypothetical protein